MKAVEHPVAGVDYPSTFQALDEWFRDEVACRAYIRRLRWPTNAFEQVAQLGGADGHRAIGRLGPPPEWLRTAEEE